MFSTVLKFGGTSVGSVESLQKVISIVSSTMQSCKCPAVIVSAFSGVTDLLVALCSLIAEHNPDKDLVVEELRKRHVAIVYGLCNGDASSFISENFGELFKEFKEAVATASAEEAIKAEHRDHLLSFGERFSAKIITGLLKRRSLPVDFLDARNVVRTNRAFGSAKVDFESTYSLIRKHFSFAKTLQVVTGFIGSTDDGRTTTLGRGGSDFSAAVFGAALDVSEIEIWTDVDGIMTADPRVVPQVFSIPAVSYEAAEELAEGGAKVVHPATIAPARRAKISVRIKNTFKPEFQGTLITSRKEQLLPGLCSLTSKPLRLDAGRGERKELDCVISLVSNSSRSVEKIQEEAQAILSQHGIDFILGDSSAFSVKVLLRGQDANDAVKALHDKLLSGRAETLNLFIAGTGLVGSALLEQIKKQQAALKEKKNVGVRVVGITNTRQMLVREQGIDLKHWEKALGDKGAKANLDAFTDHIFELGQPNVVFIDCTSSEKITSIYERLLARGVSVVTPNKKANLASYEQYKKLREMAFKGHAKFFYEANVGAGLPVISTLNDLINAGDSVLRIEAVVSGTLSYIFNALDRGSSFSDAVRSAQKLGLTEPDPRDDLSGADVARKLIILARECGVPLEAEAVYVEPLLPESVWAAKDLEDFYEELKKVDAVFAGLIDEAKSKGSVLRYVAQIEGDHASVSLQMLGPEHPFFGLSGSDNIFSFTTEHYSAQPLVVRGPGAGAKVTAAGVFADVLRTLR